MTKTFTTEAQVVEAGKESEFILTFESSRSEKGSFELRTANIEIPNFSEAFYFSISEHSDYRTSLLTVDIYSVESGDGVTVYGSDYSALLDECVGHLDSGVVSVSRGFVEAVKSDKEFSCLDELAELIYFN